MPRMYGSASGFLTMACMTTPLMDSPAPTAAASTSRGRRISQTTSWMGVPGAHSSGMGRRRKMLPSSYWMTRYTSAMGRRIVPKVTAARMDRGRIMSSARTVTA